MSLGFDYIAEMESQGLLLNRRLVGTVAVGIDEDKDMSEPPGTVGEYTGQNDDDDKDDDTQDC